jgi:hypothetical protein
MFNLFKVTSFLQSVPSTFNPRAEGQVASDHFADAPTDFNIYNIKETKKGGANQDKKEKKGDNSSKKEDKHRNGNDNNNGGGGMLQPIIEDLQGFIRGTRRPVVMPV